MIAKPGGKIIFLTGAPLSSSLQWADEFLVAPLQDSFLETSKQLSSASPSTNTGPTWRFLSIEPNSNSPEYELPVAANNLQDDSDNGDDGTHLLNKPQSSHVPAGPSLDLSQIPPSSQLIEEVNLSQFYEESFAIHEDLSSSDVTGHDSLIDTSFDESFEDTSTSLDIEPPLDAKAHRARARLTASQPRNLRDLPNAAHLQSITPQTVTVNLVVGIITILPPREITTRRDGRTVHLVEMLVGDETRAGFAINIWLPHLPETDSPTATDQDSNLATMVTQLRPRDIVLIRNAALSSFRAKVYGQSLRKGMTTIDLLHRNVVDSSDTHGAYAAHQLRDMTATEGPVGKLKRVKQWVMDFVGATMVHVLSNQDLKSDGHNNNGGGGVVGGGRGKIKRKEIQLEPLPMDTQ